MHSEEGRAQVSKKRDEKVLGGRGTEVKEERKSRKEVHGKSVYHRGGR